MRNTAKKNGNNKELQKRLVSLESRVLGELREHVARARSASAHDATEFLDMVSDSEMDDLAARMAELDSMTVDEIEDALAMIREGHYGVCGNCGKKISKRRLRARPFATLCIECKQMQERQSAPVGRPVQRPYDAQISADVDGSEDEERTTEVDGIFRDVNFSDVV